MKGFKLLTIRGILKKHNNSPKDKELHKTIQTKEVKKDTFNNLIKESTKHDPFDKKR